MEIRRFQRGDEQAISALIRRTLIEVNTDCPAWEIEWLCGYYTPENVLKMAADCHTYVLWEDGKIIGTGSVSVTGETETEIIAAYLLPEYIGFGHGTALFDTLENDPLALKADRIWLTSSVTALDFYEKRNYAYCDGYRGRGADGLITMEKRKAPPSVF